MSRVLEFWAFFYVDAGCVFTASSEGELMLYECPNGFGCRLAFVLLN